MVVLFCKYTGFMMFRLMDEINFFFETWCLRVMFQRSSAAPPCGQTWKKTDDTKALYWKAPKGSEEL